MRQTGNPTPGSAALDYDSTMIGALELSSKKWVFAIQLPGAKKHTRHVLKASGAALTELIERLKARSKAAGRPIERVILAQVAGELRCVETGGLPANLVSAGGTRTPAHSLQMSVPGD